MMTSFQKIVVGYPFNYFLILFFPVAISNCFCLSYMCLFCFPSGERLFSSHPGNAPQSSREDHRKLLEIDNSELLHMLESHESLRSKVTAI